MNHDELLNTLKSLHSQLSATEDYDVETQAMLQTVTDDLHRALARPTGADAVTEEPDTSFSTRLRDTLIELEVRHPRVGGLLERITDGLANMGI